MNRKFHSIPLLLQILILFDSASTNWTTPTEPCSILEESDFFNGSRTMDFDWMDHYNQSVPESFDARQKWPECPSISQARDQGDCGACWAVTTTSMLTDRMCIHTEGQVKFNFAPQELLTCCDQCFERLSPGQSRCDGGMPLHGIRFLMKHGGPSEACKPYNIQLVNETRVGQTACPKNCTSNYKVPYEKDKHFVDRYLVWSRYQHRSNLQHIQLEIMKNGPVITNINATQRFRHYFMNPQQRTAIYDDGMEITTQKDGHAVLLIGWGVEKGVPYWLLANSWGKEWGDNGFCKIVRGKNRLNTEQVVLAASLKARTTAPSAENKAENVSGLPGVLVASCLMCVFRWLNS